ncbi:J domain-containing protein [Halomonas sp. LS-001]
MSTARFSPFELLLLHSRNQVDTAILLLLAWLLVQRQPISEGQRRRRLAQVSAHFQHGHELGPVMQIAQQQDLEAIQLAAEIVHKECSPARRLNIIQHAIVLAGDNGKLCHANHYILRFLADLLGISPDALATLFLELTGLKLEAPADLSTQAYWLQHDPHYEERKRQEQADADKARAQAEAEAQQQQHKKREEKQRRRQEQEDRKAKARAQREKAQQEKNRQEKANAGWTNRQYEDAQRDHQRRQQQESQQHQQRSTDRSARALAVLGLSLGASRQDIRRAYRKMAQLHHPDRFFSKSDHQVALASARFQRIKSAYDYLMQRD